MIGVIIVGMLYIARDVPLPLALWLWGLLGLLLAMPLAVCLVVLGRHIRGLEFFECCSATSLRSPRHKAFTSAR